MRTRKRKYTSMGSRVTIGMTDAARNGPTSMTSSLKSLFTKSDDNLRFLLYKGLLSLLKHLFLSRGVLGFWGFGVLVT